MCALLQKCGLMWIVLRKQSAHGKHEMVLLGHASWPLVDQNKERKPPLSP